MMAITIETKQKQRKGGQEEKESPLHADASVPRRRTYIIYTYRNTSSVHGWHCRFSNAHDLFCMDETSSS